MSRTRVKICGVTCREDALLAANAGADAIGMIFHPQASRAVNTETAREIVDALPPFVTPVGLFLDTTENNVLTTGLTLGLQWIQLHGHETPAFVRSLPQFQVIKAVHVMPEKLIDALAPWRDAVAEGLPNLAGIVLETGWGAAKGGTGIENDWQQIQQVRDDGGFDGLPPIIVAGGLRPENVGRVIELIEPFAVDVSSGVEQTRGRKSPDLISAVMRAVRQGDHARRHPQ